MDMALQKFSSGRDCMWCKKTRCEAKKVNVTLEGQKIKHVQVHVRD